MQGLVDCRLCLFQVALSVFCCRFWESAATTVNCEAWNKETTDFSKFSCHTSHSHTTHTSRTVNNPGSGIPLSDNQTHNSSVTHWIGLSLLSRTPNCTRSRWQDRRINRRRTCFWRSVFRWRSEQSCSIKVLYSRGHLTQVKVSQYSWKRDAYKCGNIVHVSVEVWCMLVWNKVLYSAE